MKPLKEHYQIETDAGIMYRYIDYIEDLEKYIERLEEQLRIGDVVGRSEQFKCEKCGSDWGEIRHTCYSCNHEFGDL